LKVVVLYEVVQVDGEKLKRDNQMLSKDYIVFNADDVEGIVWIILFKVHQDLEFDSRLVLEPFLVPNKLYSDKLLSLMIEAL